MCGHLRVLCCLQPFSPFLARFIIGKKGANVRAISTDLPKVQIDFRVGEDKIVVEGNMKLGALGAKTNCFSQNQLVSKALSYLSFPARKYEETKYIFWASDVVETLTHVRRFYNLMIF